SHAGTLDLLRPGLRDADGPSLRGDLPLAQPRRQVPLLTARGQALAVQRGSGGSGGRVQPQEDRGTPRRQDLGRVRARPGRDVLLRAAGERGAQAVDDDAFPTPAAAFSARRRTFLVTLPRLSLAYRRQASNFSGVMGSSRTRLPVA